MESINTLYQHHYFPGKRNCVCGGGDGYIERDHQIYVCAACSWLTARNRVQPMLQQYGLAIPRASLLTDNKSDPLKKAFFKAANGYQFEANPLTTEPVIIKNLAGGPDLAGWIAQRLYGNPLIAPVHAREHLVLYTTASILMSAMMVRDQDKTVNDLIQAVPFLVMYCPPDARKLIAQIEVAINSRQYGLAVMVV